ncbi:MAG: rhomboid family intramembrane serine protease [Hydrococcus sp. C42_A2020_068]|uniref:rhomboid family intramembrane serine protease n=1 Tax=Pleurocapsa sp. PCC 7327 TaxID=118163 RepID=UPI0002A000B5|nr:rhomboid family intramembrane serine protease [Pleurocapsa sp. PCC 7327]AFY76864.1 putative membrane protein [Pleurocapsa sp. PCC 7327]MBF2020852.1 rhomboid family intramembrane serine protease [Hydrococcus sp. C42_A2020_068]
MVPLHDNNPTRITPYLTYTLIGINVFVFLHELSLSPQQLEQFFYTYGVVPRELTASLSSGDTDRIISQSLTLVTSQFLHGGFLHIAGNMLFLWVFGNNIEDQLGRIKYLIFYLTCGVLAALTQWFFSMQSGVPAIGASGAIAGVLGAYIIRFPKAQILTLVPLGFFLTTIRIPAVFFLGFWFVQQALYGVASLQAPANIGMEGGGIAYWAHAGGFVFGAILGPILGLFSSRNKERFF